jgi:hypothetical protein
MSLHDQLTEFAGLPVLRFEPETVDTLDFAAIDPAGVAWRIAGWEDEDDDWEKPLSPTFEGLFQRFLDSVDTSRVTALVIGTWGYAAMNYAPIELLASAADRLPALRSLFLGDIPQEECEISWIRQGEVGRLLSAYPRLRTLTTRGGGPQGVDEEGLTLVPVRHSRLTSLTMQSGGLPGAVVRAVGDSDLPALASLELWLGVAFYGGDATIADLGPILSGQRLPALRELRLRNAENTDEIAAALAGAPVLAQLEVLDLSMGTLGDDGAAALLAGQPLTHLRELDLSHHFLTEPMMRRLTDELGAAGVRVNVADQLVPDGWQDGGRYVAVAE